MQQRSFWWQRCATERSLRHVQLRPSVCHNLHDTLRRLLLVGCFCHHQKPSSSSRWCDICGVVESDNRQGTGTPPRQWWKGRLPAPLGHERRVASLAATLHSTSSQPFPLLSRFSLTRVLACSLGSRAAFVSPNDMLTILSSGHSGEIGALAMVMWQGQSCAVMGSMHGTVRTQFTQLKQSRALEVLTPY